MTDDRRGWWSRHWKWAVPSGCLLVVLLAFGGCVALVVGAFATLKDTGAYSQAIGRVQHSPEAVALLGEPIEAGWMMQGEFADHGATGDADYSVPVSGPRGRGTLYVEARKSGGRWTFRVLTLVPDDGAEIDLRTPEERSGRNGDDAPASDTPPLEKIRSDDGTRGDAVRA